MILGGSAIANLLDGLSPPDTLIKIISDRWTYSPITPASLSSSKDSRNYFDVATGAQAADGASLLTFVLYLVKRKTVRVENVIFISVSKAEVVHLIHSLLVV